MDVIVNPERDWRSTTVGENLLNYASDAAVNSHDLNITNFNTDSSTFSSNTSAFKTDNTFETIKFTTNVDESIIYGGDEKDRLAGSDRNDIIYGYRGNDRLSGREGDDILIGGEGNDILIGGNGRDLFVLSHDDGIDVIKDFTINQDLIQLSGNLKFDDLTIVQSTGARNRSSAHLYLAENNELLAIVENIYASELTLLDFI